MSSTPADEEESADTDPPPTEDAPIARGSKALIYRGRADLYEHGDYQFRPGQPVVVPSDVAEDLLTTPFVKFEEVEE